jgi:hypothetical protein
VEQDELWRILIMRVSAGFLRRRSTKRMTANREQEDRKRHATAAQYVITSWPELAAHHAHIDHNPKKS